MSDDGSGGIGDIFSGIVDAAGGELKKFGQSASGQVTGSKGGQSAPAADAAGSLAGQLKKFGQSATSQVTGSAPGGDAPKVTDKSKYDYSLFGELKKIGQSALGQVSGNEELSKMQNEDKAFSDRESEVIKARIKAVYAEHAAKSARKDQQEEMMEKQEEKQQEQIKEVKKEELSNRAIQQTRAEIKNYGAE